MPNVAEETTATTEQAEELSEEQQDFQPGELCAVDATDSRVDIDDDEENQDGEQGLTADEKKGCLSGLSSKAAQRDLVSRRLQVRDAWKQRYFYRGNQRLLPGPKNTWVTPSQVNMGAERFSGDDKETNMYLAFGDTITASLTAGLPGVRFEADNPTNAADLTAAENAENARLLIERANNMIVVQEDVGRFLWTDGLAVVYVRHVVDAQRFGYSNPAIPDVADELSYMPEFGSTGPGGTPAGEQQEQETAQNPTNRGTPRGQEVIKALGTLEVKLPLQAGCLEKCNYAQWSEEIDIAEGKTLYPKKADQIKASVSPTAESEYERLARTSIMMGMRPSNMTNDSMTYNVTKQYTWFRPGFYSEEEDETLRNWLYETFPDGCLVIMMGTTFCEARNESMDDHLTLIHARPGDGMHRPSNGAPLVPLQEKLNDCMDLVHESFMHLIPRIWVDSEGVDAAAMNETKRAPSQYFKIKRKGDKEIASNFYTETQIQIAEGLLTYIEKLFGEFSQFLCGAFPALFGGNTGSNDTASGIASQRDQALGRVGISWRNIKAGYASVIRQAVMAAAKYREDTMTGTLPGQGGNERKITLDPNDLKGNIRCFPSSDENFPESWVAQRAIWMQLLEQAKANPILGAIIGTPTNMMIAKSKIGVPELDIAPAASAKKQRGEINILLTGPPTPNPEVEQAKQQATAQVTQAKMAGQVIPPEALQAIEAKVAAMPQVISTVPVEKKMDDHASEMSEIKAWANSDEGITSRTENQQGWANVQAHYAEHEAALAEEQATKQGGAAGKPPSESLSIGFKDLPTKGKIQAAAKYGIELTDQDFQLEDAKDLAAEQAKNASRSAPVVQ